MRSLMNVTDLHVFSYLMQWEGIAYKDDSASKNDIWDKSGRLKEEKYCGAQIKLAWFTKV